MTYAAYYSQLAQRIVQAGEEAEALRLAFCHIKGWTLTDWVLRQRENVSSEDQQLLTSLAKALIAHKPWQYLVGQAEFCGLTLTVDERVLIPRPETEELVELILTENPEESLRVLDVGTGSGAIALALKKARPNWQVTAVDISRDALELARKNAKQLGLEVEFVQSDVLDQVTEVYDLIVSNPPYIDWADRDEVGANVLASEPHLALFAEEKGLAIYRKLAEQAPEHLAPAGKIYLEIGYKQGKVVSELFEQVFPTKIVQVLRDSFGKERMVSIHD